MSGTASRPFWSGWLNALRHRGQGNGDSISGPLPVRDYVNVNAQPSTVMGQLVKGYTDVQLQLIAGFFAAQPAGK